MTEAGRFANKSQEDSSETTSDREISQNFAFLLELIISLQKNNKDTPFEELLSIESELFNYLAQIKKIGHDQWLATRILANLLSNKIIGTNANDKIAGREMARCLDIFEKSFFLAGKLSLNGESAEQIANDKETYLNILDLWVNQNIEAIALEENQGFKNQAMRTLEERILKGKLYGNTSHKKYNNLDVMLRTARGLLPARTQKSSADATVLINPNDTNILTDKSDSESIKNIAQETTLFPVQQECKKFQFLNYSVTFRLSTVSMVFVVCLILGIAFFLFHDNSAKDLPITQQPPVKNQSAAKSPEPVKKIETVITAPTPQVDTPTKVVATSPEKIASPQADNSSVSMNSPDKVDSQTISSSEDDSKAPQRPIPDDISDNKDPIPSSNGEQPIASAEAKISAVKDVTTSSTLSEKSIVPDSQAVTHIPAVPDEPVKKPVQVEKGSNEIKNQCAALYVKLSLGKMLNKNETNFLSSNCK
jgi:hypothetical protein